ncbi:MULTISPECIES: D-cysteine desulfhydrase [Bacillaceae]|uniref:D-cysteine desulfhydrase n=1 Tax=Evansella alkalicola TaxID=745819 RepID=A0ABS6JPW3_9BACI|nr:MULTISPECIES: D-cysteine desulfhydrase [Bacillaceae]MBU9720606.1 D-cysteine desulfhydrase [Bacillus alkalicola]
MKIDQFPRNKYSTLPTPIEKASNLSKNMGGPNIFIKRDDLLGLAEGGNKTRKLEFLIADAQAKGADTIITAGGIQSNHCRLTLAACIKENLKCILILEENKDDLYHTKNNGNFLLYHLINPESVKIVKNGTDVYEEMERVANQVKSEGGSPYVIPVGGSNVIGATGYVACAQEIIQQSKDIDVQFDYVICASGSAGMQAGLLTGFLGENSSTKVIGINVSRGKVEQEENVLDLTRATAKHLSFIDKISKDNVRCFDSYVGPGYALPTKGMKEAVRLLANTEGILLDPVYTGKTMAGLINLIRQGFFNDEDNILFLHSGGTPALYAYTPFFYEEDHS